MVFKSFIQRRVGASTDFSGHSLIAAFEEPEAHLHPQAHRAMFHLIAALDAQKIVSTHSPYVVRVVEDVHSIRLLRRAPSGAISCKCVPRTTNGAATFSADEITHLRKFVLRNNGEALFARLVVVFEGDTEDQALPIFVRHHWKKDHAALGMSLARTDGAGSGKHVVRVLDHFDIPWVLFADGDLAGKRAVTGDRKGSRAQAHRRRARATTEGRVPGAVTLLDEGYREPIEDAIADSHGVTALADYREVNDGQKLNKTAVRDYQSTGWEQRLVLDYLSIVRGYLWRGARQRNSEACRSGQAAAASQGDRDTCSNALRTC